jgi:hypothetical protein
MSEMEHKILSDFYQGYLSCPSVLQNLKSATSSMAEAQRSYDDSSNAADNKKFK